MANETETAPVEFLTVREVRRRLRIRQGIVGGWIREGRLSFRQGPHRAKLVRWLDAEALAREHREACQRQRAARIAAAGVACATTPKALRRLAAVNPPTPAKIIPLCSDPTTTIESNDACPDDK